MVGEIFLGWAIGEFLSGVLGLVKRGLSGSEQKAILALTIERLGVDLPAGRDAKVLVGAVGQQLSARRVVTGLEGGADMSTALSGQLDPLLAGWFEREDGTAETGEALLGRLGIEFVQLVDLTEQALWAAAHEVAGQQGGLPWRLTQRKLDQILAQANITVSEHPAGRHRDLVPAQLPTDVQGFAGRDAEVARLDALLDSSGPHAAAVVISAVSGTAGVGKTALAVHWAHRVADRFPDGQLYVNLGGFDPSGTALSPAEAVRGFLDAFEVPPQRIPADLDAQAALYRSLLADKQVLVVLDNARDSDQIRPLLPGSPGSLVVVTSRNDLAGLIAKEGAQPFTLDLLTDAEAQQLLEQRLGGKRVSAEPAAVADIIAACARLPLALAIVAGRAAIHPHFPLQALANELRDTRLNAPTGDQDTDVRAVFSWSYAQLSTQAARMFRLLGLHPGPDLSAPAAASLAGIPPADVSPLLRELTRSHLITEHTPGRYTFHDLLRAYAGELAQTQTPNAERAAVQRRMLDHYLHPAHAGTFLLQQHQDSIPMPPVAADVTLEQLTSHGQALAWFTTEHAVLLAVLEQADRSQLDAHALTIAWAFAVYLSRQHWHDAIATQHLGLEAARRLQNKRGQAKMHEYLVHGCTQLHRFDDAYSHGQRAIDLYDELGEDTGLAGGYLNLGVVLHKQGNYAEAFHQYQRALDLFRSAAHQPGQALALQNIGSCHARLRSYQQAMAYSHQALAIHQRIGNRIAEAYTWHNLGYIHQHLSDYQQALTCYQRAINMLQDLGDPHKEAETFAGLGDTYHAAGNHPAARTARQQALKILDELGHPDAEQIRAKLADDT